ncbi:hypothetical protein CDD82_4639 [Ophiocordyceps australis]|uniref:Peroxin-19 n=1 Tax=Ophiocordyceps australis TaxID=1399860 RepID=A0A2C5Z5K7_9HYPO|nr:hypothetical protein CDD82_4639 [Ophiocordyceps australis]
MADTLKGHGAKVKDSGSEPLNQLEEVPEVPDPDEDDLDDLDDMLDEFSSVKLTANNNPSAVSIPREAATSSQASASKGPGSSTAESLENLADDFSEDELAKQMQAGMAGLLGELDKSPEMQQQFEEIFKQMAAAAVATEANPAQGSSVPNPANPSSRGTSANDASSEDASFQDTIRRTMERMQSSGEQATAAAASGTGDDVLSEMLKQFSGSLDAGDGEDGLSKMLMGMMEQLTNKEILYEPMKELDTKFPDWLRNNRSSTPADDLAKYEEQQVLVREIVAKFEESTYSDSNASDREYIVDRMQKMQAAGSPPPDLVGDMPSAQEALNASDDQCNPQ